MISIFKTNVSNTAEIEKFSSFFETHPEIINWNFDLEDCDNILRIESLNPIAYPTIKILKENGFDCQELGD